MSQWHCIRTLQSCN